ncbi:helix-turn-helix domain-containing protein [Actinomadura chokoriensis]|uniref:helix-turn-helix domain-containing protein n=1 Tax=Actinomadura chokoriensis TaxID=454156 RepID=UPI0031F9FF40
MKPGLTPAELRSLPVTIDLVTAARAFGIGRTKAYQLARTGTFPCRVLQVGRNYRVSTADLQTALGLSPKAPASGDPGTTGGQPPSDEKEG